MYSADTAPLPENLDAERYLLGAVFGDNNRLSDLAERLTEEDFSSLAHRFIFARMLTMKGRGESIDRVTLANALNSAGELQRVGGLAALTDLDTGMPVSPALNGYMDIVQEKSILRRIALLGRQMSTSALGPAADSKEILQEISGQVFNVLRKTERNPSVQIGDYIEGFEKRGEIGALLDPSITTPGLLTGFTRFDELTDGFHESEIFIVAGAPSTGKTALGLQIVQRILKPLDESAVLVLSMEMPRRALLNRLACSIAGVPVNLYRRGQLQPKQRVALMEALEYLKLLPIWVDDNTGLSPVRMRMKIENVLRVQPLKLIVLDYIQLSTSNSTSKYENENSKLTEVCIGIQQIAKELKVPWLILSQLSRADRKLGLRPGLHSLRGSGTIEQIGNVIAFIYFEERKRKDENRRKDEFELLVEKNREGEKGDIPFRFIGWRGAFEERFTEQVALAEY